jgi:2-amino-4-hydroxy-6-hydroxymethyldihydropteridine diphosphokinase
MNTTTAYLLLGSNLGDRMAHLRAALAQLVATAGTLVDMSNIYETAAWGREAQPAFLNQVLALRTSLPSDELLLKCQATENHAGRERREQWGSRTLDVDILLFGYEIINTPTLTVPHPQLAARRFALVPLAEIAGLMIPPGQHLTVDELLEHCPDPLSVRVWPGG